MMKKKLLLMEQHTDEKKTPLTPGSQVVNGHLRLPTSLPVESLLVSILQASLKQELTSYIHGLPA